MPVWKTNPLFLRLSLKSILEQSYGKFELLVIYQKSQEEIDAQIEKIFNENCDDPRLKIIEMKDKGFTNSLNFGLEHAKGEFIARMDSDDISDKNRFEEQINHLKNTNDDLVGSWAYSISEKGESLGKIETPISSSDIKKKIMFHNPFLHPTIFFRTSLIKKVGNYDQKFEGAEDYDFYCRVIASNCNVSNIPKYLIKLRETEGSIMRGKGWQKKRKVYWKVKKNAIFTLGFKSSYDLWYFFLTILSLPLTPKMALFVKRKIGYNKN